MLLLGRLCPRSKNIIYNNNDVIRKLFTHRRQSTVFILNVAAAAAAATTIGGHLVGFLSCFFFRLGEDNIIQIKLARNPISIYMVTGVLFHLGGGNEAKRAPGSMSTNGSQYF